MGSQADDDPGPGQAPRPGGSQPELLAAFEHGGAWETAAPSAALAAALQAAAGPEELYDGAGPDAMVGITRQWTALESWAAAGTLGSLRALTREDGQGRPLTRRRSDLPDGWGDNLIYEIAGALAMGPVSATNLAGLAWTLGLRLPGIGRLLADGTLTKPKAKLIVQTFEPLSEDEATRAEALILGELEGKTWFQVQRLAWRAALAVAPDIAERRRAQAEKRRARVTLFREESGAVGLSGRDLPTAEALAGHANVLARADQYEASGAFPDHTPGTLQALAYLHLLRGVTIEDAIAFARTATAQPPDTTGQDDEDDEDDWDPFGEDPRGKARRGAGDPGNGRSHGDDDDDDDDDGGPDDGGPYGDDDDPGGGDAPGDGQSHGDDDEGPDDDDGWHPSDGGGPGNDGDPADDGEPGRGSGPSGGGDPADDGDPADGGDPGDPGGGSGPGDGDGPGGDQASPASGGGRAVLPEVTAPLATLQRRAKRPGDNRLLGPLDPALTRDLATAAARSPHSRWEITIVDEHGYAVGHGIARPRRGKRHQQHQQHRQPQPPGPAWCALPARVNITVTETLLGQLAAQPRSGAPPADWELTPQTAGAGDRTWALTLPGGRELLLRFDAVPTHDCDHRHQVTTYQPSDKLRRLVQVRDHECTFPPCSRPAHESDFEHAIPYHKGGKTDACNAGARSRRCHQVKQMQGWSVTQPKPGWHVWTTPTGRTYVQEPWRYIA
jgi:hypothetical protein